MQSPIARFFIIGACFVILVAGMRAAASFLAPALFALLIAIAVLPIINWLERRCLPTWASVLVVVLAVVAIGGILIGLTTSSVVQLANELPSYQVKFTVQFTHLSNWLARLRIPIPQTLPSEVLDPAKLLGAVGKLLSILAGGTLTSLLIILLFVVFSIELPRLSTLMYTRIERESVMDSRMHLLGKNITSYFTVRALNNLFVSVALTILFLVLGVDLAVFWGVLIFFLGYIPNIGLPLAVLPPFLLAWLDRGIGVALAVLIGSIIINLISDNILTPRLAGKALNMSMSAVFLSFIFWSWVLGPIGALISVPLTSLLMAGLDCYDETRWIADLLSAGKMMRFSEKGTPVGDVDDEKEKAPE